MKLDFCKDWTVKPLGSEDAPQHVTIPHDAMITEKRIRTARSSKNVGWYEGLDYLYEKHFTVPEIYEGQKTVLEFESVYRKSTVTINGHEAGGTEYGYTGFYVDATPYVNGGSNVLQVTALNSDQPNSRWYSGTGIYRPVSMHILPAEHILLDGIRVTSVDARNRVVKVEVRTNVPGTVCLEVVHGSKSFGKAEVVTSEVGPSDVFAADADVWIETEFKGAYGETLMTLEGAHLWSCDHPNLYTLKAHFGEDSQSVVFGIRELTIDSRHGLRINGKRTLLRGACIHHDNGILGACAYPDAEERKIRLMKEAGYNAIRSAHNPCSKATLEACDRLGMLLMDEFTDSWYIHKTKYDYASSVMQNYKIDLGAMAVRDYNHPSVVLYSTGNEVAETSEAKGIEFTRTMTDYLHLVDPTRKVSCGVNIFFNFLYSMGMGVYSDEKADTEPDKEVGSAFYNKLAATLGDSFMKFGATLHGSDVKTRGGFAAMDVAGYNYGIWRYKKDCRKYPDRVILGSETFVSDAALFWDIAKDHPAVIGDFVWAGITYLGEIPFTCWDGDTLIGSPDWGTAGSGRLDMNGRAWSESDFTKVAFELEKIGIGVTPVNLADDKYDVGAWNLTYAYPSWSWDGLEGKKTAIEVYARADKAEVLINGKSLGIKKLRKYRAVFPTVYTSGTVKAIAYDAAGQVYAETELKTAGKETRLTLVKEEGTKELRYVRLQYTDEAGTIKPYEKGMITVEAENAELLGLGDARPVNPRYYNTNQTEVYYGEALAVLRPTGNGLARIICHSPHGDAEIEL